MHIISNSKLHDIFVVEKVESRLWVTKRVKQESARRQRVPELLTRPKYLPSGEGWRWTRTRKGSKWKFVRKTPTNQAALLFDDFGELCLRTMRSGKDFETRTSIWKVREPGCYGLRDQSRAKMAKSSRAVKRERKKVSSFDSPVPTFLHSRDALRSLLRLLLWQDWFHEFVMCSTQDEWSFDRRVTFVEISTLLYTCEYVPVPP